MILTNFKNDYVLCKLFFLILIIYVGKRSYSIYKFGLKIYKYWTLVGHYTCKKMREKYHSLEKSKI